VSGIPISITEFPIVSRFLFFTLCFFCALFLRVCLQIQQVGRLNGVVVLGHAVLLLCVKWSRKLIVLNISDNAFVHR